MRFPIYVVASHGSSSHAEDYINSVLRKIVDEYCVVRSITQATQLRGMPKGGMLFYLWLRPHPLPCKQCETEILRVAAEQGIQTVVVTDWM